MGSMCSSHETNWTIHIANFESLFLWGQTLKLCSMAKPSSAVASQHISEVDLNHELRSNMDTTHANKRIVCVGTISTIVTYQLQTAKIHGLSRQLLCRWSATALLKRSYSYRCDHNPALRSTRQFFNRYAVIVYKRMETLWSMLLAIQSWAHYYLSSNHATLQPRQQFYTRSCQTKAFPLW